MNETASPGVVDQADYDAWRANFGATSGSGSGIRERLRSRPRAKCYSALFAMAAGCVWIASRRRISRI